MHARSTTRTSRDWVAAQREALEGAVPGLIRGGRESRPGVWLSRNARIHPEARILAPAWIGEDVRVERGAAVGPGAVVGAGSIVDAGTRVEAALVTPGTYLGESMELKDAVADRGVVTHTRIGASRFDREAPGFPRSGSGASRPGCTRRDTRGLEGGLLRSAGRPRERGTRSARRRRRGRGAGRRGRVVRRHPLGAAGRLASRAVPPRRRPRSGALAPAYERRTRHRRRLNDR